MKVADGSLRIRSRGAASRYLGRAGDELADADGYIDSGDMVELRDGRYYFVGRRGGIINIGGLKVHPEEIEAVINRHADVRMSCAKSRRSPITGSIVAADVVLADGSFVTASETENADLFWAVRGGGGNFGIVTAFEYRLHTVSPMMYGGRLMFGPADAADVLKFFAG